MASCTHLNLSHWQTTLWTVAPPPVFGHPLASWLSHLFQQPSSAPHGPASSLLSSPNGGTSFPQSVRKAGALAIIYKFSLNLFRLNLIQTKQTGSILKIKSLIFCKQPPRFTTVPISTREKTVTDKQIIKIKLLPRCIIQVPVLRLLLWMISPLPWG